MLSHGILLIIPHGVIEVFGISLVAVNHGIQRLLGLLLIALAALVEAMLTPNLYVLIIDTLCFN